MWEKTLDERYILKLQNFPNFFVLIEILRRVWIGKERFSVKMKIIWLHFFESLKTSLHGKFNQFEYVEMFDEVNCGMSTFSVIKYNFTFLII